MTAVPAPSDTSQFSTTSFSFSVHNASPMPEQSYTQNGVSTLSFTTFIFNSSLGSSQVLNSTVYTGCLLFCNLHH